MNKVEVFEYKQWLGIGEAIEQRRSVNNSFHQSLSQPTEAPAAWRNKVLNIMHHGTPFYQRGKH